MHETDARNRMSISAATDYRNFAPGTAVTVEIKTNQRRTV
jgi:hypothetical protein